MKEKEDERPTPSILKKPTPSPARTPEKASRGREVLESALAASRNATPSKEAEKASRGREVLESALAASRNATPSKEAELRPGSEVRPASPIAPKPKKVRFAHQPPSRTMLDFASGAEQRRDEPTSKPRDDPAGSKEDPCKGPKTKPKEDPFKVPNHFRTALTDYLTGTPYHHPAAVPPIAADEDALAYSRGKRKALNKTPKVLSVIKAFLPPIIRHNTHLRHPTLLVGLLGHIETLQGLVDWWQQGDWSGCTALLHFNYSEFTNYGFPPTPTPYASVLELHRRALRLEGAVSSLSTYLAAVVQNSHGLKRLSQLSLADAAAVLASGSGAYGTGRDFWTPAPPSSSVVHKLLGALSPAKDAAPPNQEAAWLAANRINAFTRLHPGITELDWGISLLALVFRLQQHLARLETAEAAESLRGALQRDTANKLHVYYQQLLPLALYGGNLTKYLERVYALALAFKPLGDEARIDFPANCKLATLDDSGRMLGLDGRPSPLGHLEFSLAGKAVPLIPFPDTCRQLQPLPPDQLSTLVSVRICHEETLIEEMLAMCFPSGSSGEPKALQAMRLGRSNMLVRMMDDSHLFQRTYVLPPTASLPDAVYDPEAVFAPP